MDPFPVDTIESIWRMQRLVNHIARPFDTRRGKEFNLSIPQFRVMRAIAVFPGISAQEISEFDGVNTMLVSRAVALLEKRGWVTRTVDEADARRMKLTLTVPGREVFGTMYPNMEARYRDVLSPLSDHEQAVLNGLLQKLLAHVSGEELGDDLVEIESADSSPPPHQNLITENQNLRELLIDLQMENYQLKKQLTPQ